MYLSTEIEASVMPKMLLKATQVADSPAQCDMLFLSLLTASGYAMPNYVVRHGIPAHDYYPSLMTLVVAPPASGKGIMNLSRRVLMPLHEEKRLIPANSSSNAFLQLLLDNNGRGFMQETEMDVLSQIWKKDYGNYSSAFRQAFEHETITKSRKMPGEDFVEVKNPALSVVLSGTINQLKPLLVSRENGLASRFLTYVIEDIVPFREEVFIKHDESAQNDTDGIFEHMGRELQRLSHWLENQPTTCEYQLAPAQAEELRKFFADGYRLTMNDLQMPLTFDSVMKRMAVTLLRIGMIIRMLRYWEDEVEPRLSTGEKVPVPAVLTCTDEEFQMLMQLTEVLIYHAIATHNMLPGEDDKFVEETPSPAMQLLDMLPKQFTTAEAKAAGEKMGKSKRTVDRFLNQLKKENRITQLNLGRFIKV